MRFLKHFLGIIIISILIFPTNLSAATGSYILSSSVTTPTVGSSFNVSFSVQSAAVVDTIKLCVSYDTNVLTLINFNYSRTPAFTMAQGECLFYGAFNPGFSSGTVANLNFRANIVGSAIIRVTGSSLAISNGSYVTINSFGSTEIQVANLPTVTTVPTTTTIRYTVPAAPVVSSATHPDEARWYQGKSPELTWTKANGVSGFSYSFDDNAITIPDGAQDGTDTSIKISNVTEGTHYFHIRAQNQYGWGSPRHFKVNVDTAPPDNLKLEFEIGGTEVEPVNHAKFEATDSTSGIDHYQIKIDDGEYLFASSPFALPIKDQKEHKITVKAKDKAGNFTSKTMNFSAQETKIPAPEIVKISSTFEISNNSPELVKKYLLEGRGIAKTKVRIYIDGIQKAEVKTAKDKTWQGTLSDLKNGKHVATARAVFGDRISEESNSLDFSIGTDGVLVLGEKKTSTWYYLLALPIIIFLMLIYLLFIRTKLHKRFLKNQLLKP